MISLESFPPEMRIAVVGASGGIGTALVQQLVDHPRVAAVYAFSRTPCSIVSAKVVHAQLDFANEESIAQCATQASSASPLDIVIVASGILWSGDTVRPERSMGELDIGHLAHLFAVNAAGPAIIAKHFLPVLRKDSKTVFAALSARVGSIGDNRLGGWYSYRASKAALNMLLKTLSIEHARRSPQSVVIGLHPGTVNTELSRPFTSRTPKEKLFSPATAASHLVNVLDSVCSLDSGRVFAWDGSPVPA